MRGRAVSFAALGFPCGEAAFPPMAVLLIALAHCQHHLVIAADAVTVIHPHAGLRRVVLQALDPAWQVHAKWRFAPQREG